MYKEIQVVFLSLAVINCFVRFRNYYNFLTILPFSCCGCAMFAGL